MRALFDLAEYERRKSDSVMWIGNEKFGFERVRSVFKANVNIQTTSNRIRKKAKNGFFQKWVWENEDKYLELLRNYLSHIRK